MKSEPQLGAVDGIALPGGERSAAVSAAVGGRTPRGLAWTSAASALGTMDATAPVDAAATLPRKPRRLTSILRAMLIPPKSASDHSSGRPYRKTALAGV